MDKTIPKICVVLDCGNLEIFSNINVDIKVLNFDECEADFDLLNEEHENALKNMKRVY